MNVLTWLYDVCKAIFDPLHNADPVSDLARYRYLSTLEDRAVPWPDSEILPAFTCKRVVNYN